MKDSYSQISPRYPQDYPIKFEVSSPDWKAKKNNKNFVKSF